MAEEFDINRAKKASEELEVVASKIRASYKFGSPPPSQQDIAAATQKAIEYYRYLVDYEISIFGKNPF